MQDRAITDVLTISRFLAVMAVAGSQVLLAQVPVQTAWSILEKGHMSRNARERFNSVRALEQLPGDAHAVELAEERIKDKKPGVRAAAALTLGPLNSARSIPLLQQALKDKSIQVDFAASNALLSLGDASGYTIYYQVLTGKRKSGEGPVEERIRLVKDSKAMSLTVLDIAVGFAPYGGYSWAMFQVMSKDYAGPVRIEAVEKLAKHPNVEAETALIKAAADKNWRVRTAALEARAGTIRDY